MSLFKWLQSIFANKSTKHSSSETQESKSSTKYVLDSVFPNKTVQDEILNRLHNEN